MNESKKKITKRFYLFFILLFVIVSFIFVLLKYPSENKPKPLQPTAAPFPHQKAKSNLGEIKSPAKVLSLSFHEILNRDAKKEIEKLKRELKETGNSEKEYESKYKIFRSLLDGCYRSLDKRGKDQSGFWACLGSTDIYVMRYMMTIYRNCFTDEEYNKYLKLNAHTTYMDMKMENLICHSYINHTEPGERSIAVFTLGIMGLKSSLYCLEIALNDSERNIREDAVFFIKYINNPVPIKAEDCPKTFSN